MKFQSEIKGEKQPYSCANIKFILHKDVHKTNNMYEVKSEEIIYRSQDVNSKIITTSQEKKLPYYSSPIPQ